MLDLRLVVQPPAARGELTTTWQWHAATELHCFACSHGAGTGRLPWAEPLLFTVRNLNEGALLGTKKRDTMEALRSGLDAVGFGVDDAAAASSEARASASTDALHGQAVREHAALAKLTTAALAVADEISSMQQFLRRTVPELSLLRAESQRMSEELELIRGEAGDESDLLT